MSQLSDHRYRALFGPDGFTFLNKVSLERPLSEDDGTDALLALPSVDPDADPADRRRPIHVSGTYLIDTEAQGYQGPHRFDTSSALLELASFLNDCICGLEPPAWDETWP